MARRFYSSGKNQNSSSRWSPEDLSQKMEAWSFSGKTVLFLGTFFFFFLLGTILAAFLNSATIAYLAKVGRLTW